MFQKDVYVHFVFIFEIKTIFFLIHKKIWKKELDEDNEQLKKHGMDKSVANAMANSNVEMSIKKNTH